MDSPPINTSSTDNIEVETPQGKHKVTFRPYATGRLRKETRGVFLKYASMDTSQLQGKSKEQIKNMDAQALTKMSDVPAEIIEDIKEITLRNMIVKIVMKDGAVHEDRNEFANVCLDMQDEDFDFLVKRANEIAGETSMDDDQKKA